MFHWLGCHAFIAESPGSIPCWETKLPQPHGMAKTKRERLTSLVVSIIFNMIYITYIKRYVITFHLKYILFPKTSFFFPPLIHELFSIVLLNLQPLVIFLKKVLLEYGSILLQSSGTLLMFSAF